MITKGDVRSRVGYNDVGDIHIRYEINQVTGQPVTSIRAYLEIDEERIGTVTLERDGRLYVSYDKENDISFDVKRQVMTAVLTDGEEVFNEAVEVN